MLYSYSMNTPLLICYNFEFQSLIIPNIITFEFMQSYLLDFHYRSFAFLCLHSTSNSTLNRSYAGCMRKLNYVISFILGQRRNNQRTINNLSQYSILYFKYVIELFSCRNNPTNNPTKPLLLVWKGITVYFNQREPLIKEKWRTNSIIYVAFFWLLMIVKSWNQTKFRVFQC